MTNTAADFTNLLAAMEKSRRDREVAPAMNSEFIRIELAKQLDPDHAQELTDSLDEWSDGFWIRIEPFPNHPNKHKYETVKCWLEIVGIERRLLFHSTYCYGGGCQRSQEFFCPYCAVQWDLLSSDEPRDFGLSRTCDHLRTIDSSVLAFKLEAKIGRAAWGEIRPYCILGDSLIKIEIPGFPVRHFTDEEVFYNDPDLQNPMVTWSDFHDAFDFLEDAK